METSIVTNTLEGSGNNCTLYAVVTLVTTCDINDMEIFDLISPVVDRIDRYEYYKKMTSTGFDYKVKGDISCKCLGGIITILITYSIEYSIATFSTVEPCTMKIWENCSSNAVANEEKDIEIIVRQVEAILAPFEAQALARKKRLKKLAETKQHQRTKAPQSRVPTNMIYVGSGCGGFETIFGIMTREEYESMVDNGVPQEENYDFDDEADDEFGFLQTG